MYKVFSPPNLITFIRIIGTVGLLFLEPFSVIFFVIYTLTGVTDILDGFVARRTNSSSEFGAKLDSVADLLFYGIMIIRIFPKLLKKVSIPIWIAVGVIVVIRIAAYLIAGIKYGCFASLHTYMNKLTGFTVFCAPYFCPTGYMTAYCIVVCVVAFLSSTEELFTHITRGEYRSNLKSIFEKE